MTIKGYKDKIVGIGVIVLILALVVGILLYFQQKPAGFKLQVSDETVETTRQELQVSKPASVTPKVEQTVRKELQKAPMGGGLTEEEKAKIRAELQKTNN